MAVSSSTTAPIAKSYARTSIAAFLVPFLATVLTLSLLYALVAWIVNPDGDFHTKLFPRVRTDYQSEKMDLFTTYARSGPVDGLILGSSRTMNLNPKHLDNLTHLRFFNFGLASATAEDYWASFSWVRAQGQRPKAVVIALDVEALQNVFRPKPGELTKYALKDYNPSPFHYFTSLVPKYFRFYYARDIAYSMWLRLRPQPPAIHLQPDGDLIYLKHQRQRADGTFRLDRPSMNTCIAQTVEKFDGMTSLGVQRREYLETTIREAQKDGAKVVLWMTTLHPWTVQELDRTTRYAYLVRLTQSYLSYLRAKYGITTYDFSKPEDYGGTTTGFYDCGHIDESNAVLIENRIGEALR